MTALNSDPNQGPARAFTIDLHNNVEAHPSKYPASSAPGLVKFESEKDLARIAAGWQGSRLVEIWNKLPGVRSVGKFTDRRTALRRIWQAVEGLAPSRGKAPETESARLKSTKTAHILALMKRPTGATLSEIMSLSGWQPHSVRGFISAHSKKTGVRVESFKRNGERVYRIRP